MNVSCGPHLLACRFGMSPSCIFLDSLVHRHQKPLSSGPFSGSWAVPNLPMHSCTLYELYLNLCFYRIAINLSEIRRSTTSDLSTFKYCVQLQLRTQWSRRPMDGQTDKRYKRFWKVYTFEGDLQVLLGGSMSASVWTLIVPVRF
jgi:hypothetical protein